MPCFEEVLAEDGYADMFAIARQLVKYGFDGTIDVDHVFRNPNAGKDAPSLAGGSVWSAGYATGYMKVLSTLRIRRKKEVAKPWPCTSPLESSPCWS